MSYLAWFWLYNILSKVRFFSKYRQCIVKFKCQLISNEVLACIVYNDTSTFINDFFSNVFVTVFVKPL